MQKILALLTEALNLMVLQRDKATDLANDAKNLKERCTKELEEIKAKASEISQKMSDLAAREAAIGVFENFEDQKRKHFSEVENFRIVKAKSDDDLTKRRSAIEELEGQLKLRKEKLAEQSATLEKEKTEYREKIKAEIKATLG